MSVLENNINALKKDIIKLQSEVSNIAKRNAPGTINVQVSMKDKLDKKIIFYNQFRKQAL
jgi:hypothetical protein